MKWPFRPQRETDFRMFFDPETGSPTLRIQGDVKIIGVVFEGTLDAKSCEEAALRLRDQIDCMYPKCQQTDKE